nr:hypothetical protein [Tanacetum cinerariifolium]
MMFSIILLQVLLGITAPELDILDKFEDYEYEKKLVNVSLLDTSENLQAYAYVWVNHEDPDLYGEWDFEKVGIKDFPPINVHGSEDLSSDMTESEKRTTRVVKVTT